MKKSLPLVLLVILLSCVANVFSQERREPGPPKVLYIVREDIKPGMMDAHSTHSAGYANIFRTLATPNYRIALVPVAGSENEVVYITGVDTFKELEEMLNGTDKKMSAATGNTKAELERLAKQAPELHAAMRDMFAVLRPELSYNPGIDIRQMRYFQITTTRVRPGHDAQYAEYVQKVLNVARQKVKPANLHVAVFQVTSGNQAGMYLIMRPLKSLAELDDNVGMQVRNAMDNDAKKDADKAVSEAIISSDVSTYWFAPNMSYVEKDFAAGDPAFWNPKPAPKPRPRKRVAKPAAPAPPTD
jgi:hypothetical protein